MSPDTTPSSSPAASQVHAIHRPEVAQDRGRLGDLTGLDVVHLQCHLGTDTVSLSRLGARRTVGVDLSPGSLSRAREIADTGRDHFLTSR